MKHLFLMLVLCQGLCFAAITQGDFEVTNFSFRSGETLPKLRLHYRTLGTPKRDANGQVTNAVVLLHGTGSSGASFTGPNFASELFGKGQVLDAEEYFIIMPDSIGHGGSSKPSDNLRTAFPHYVYEDMVVAQHELLSKGLGIKRARLILGTSMGCSHAFVWATTFADFADAYFQLGCAPTEITGRNRMWRRLIIDGIKNDPAYQNGNYTTQPLLGLRNAASLSLILAHGALHLQSTSNSSNEADRFAKDFVSANMTNNDANDLIYALESSRDYDPRAKLSSIKASLTLVNFSDDVINPPELGIVEPEMKKVKKGRSILYPASAQTNGHLSIFLAAIWKDQLAKLLETTPKGAQGSARQ